jgi:hypothetical protein
VVVILKAMNAFAIVNGKEEEPPVSNTAAVADYQKQHAFATSVIRFSCTEEVAIYINGLLDPREMWETLKERLDSTTSYIGRVAMVTKFQNARPATGESMRLHRTPASTDFNCKAQRNKYQNKP